MQDERTNKEEREESNKRIPESQNSKCRGGKRHSQKARDRQSEREQERREMQNQSEDQQHMQHDCSCCSSLTRHRAQQSSDNDVVGVGSGMSRVKSGFPLQIRTTATTDALGMNGLVG